MNSLKLIKREGWMSRTSYDTLTLRLTPWAQTIGFAFSAPDRHAPAQEDTTRTCGFLFFSHADLLCAVLRDLTLICFCFAQRGRETHRCCESGRSQAASIAGAVWSPRTWRTCCSNHAPGSHCARGLATLQLLKCRAHDTHYL